MRSITRHRVGVCLLVGCLVFGLVGCPPLPEPGKGVPRTPGIVPGGIGSRDTDKPAPVTEYGPGTYLFCFWNVENCFDDQDDGRTTRGDDAYDGWFAEDKEARNQKYANLRRVLLGLNDGRGPDILALAEVESERSVELLRDELNRNLDVRDHYTTIAYEDPKGSRHIATAVLTRLPLIARETRLLGRRMRILETRVKVNGAELVIVASHWSSRLSDKDGDTRSKYADQIYGRFRGMVKANPELDYLVCGDFNDDPTDESVAVNLHATGDAAAVKASSSETGPMLYNPFATLFARTGEGTHYYRKWHQFDHICMSAGLLDRKGWSYVPDSAAVVREIASRNGRPNRFGTRKETRPLSTRGAADHFAVTVSLKVQ